MKLTVLVDNNTIIDRYFYGEPGVSYYLETDEKKVLFDVGYSDAFLKNASKMNISFYKLDYLLLSHGHLDHTWGLDPLIKYYSEAVIEKIPLHKPTLIAHPDTFTSKLLPEGEIGSLLSANKLSNHFNLKLSKGPVWLTDALVYLGEIPRTNSFENRNPIGVTQKNGNQKADYLKDDSALAFKSSKGLVVITGCSHSGICNIIEYATKVTGEQKIIDIIGGFHLLNPSAKVLEKTVQYFSKINSSAVHACHCTDFRSKVALSQVANLQEVGVGLTLEYK